MSIVLNGTTGIVLPDTGVAISSNGGTFLGPVNLPSGGLNVGSGQLRVDGSGRVLNSSQPAFHASRRSSGASATSSHSVPALSDMYFNYGSHYNTSTYRFTAPVAGKYVFTAHVIPTGLAQNSSFEAWLDVNGTGGNRHFFDRRKKNEADSNTFSVGGSLVIILAANDFVLLTTTLASYADETNCIFSGYLLG